MVRVVLIISGDVQGVGYRKWARSAAQRFKLTGWVKNREDGAVEILAEGEVGVLQDFISLCKKGPEVSWVSDVTETWSPATKEYIEFDILVI